MLMRAVVLRATGSTAGLQLQRVPQPAIVTDSQVKVRVAACGVCHRDVLDRRGAFPFIKLPSILGHEIAGTVTEVGDSVTSLTPGDKVVSLHWSPCGVCAACCDLRPTHCANNTASFFGLTVNGGYAEYTVNGASAFVKVPDGWSPVEAAPVMCTYGTVWHGAITRGSLRAGERVLVTGASGGVGSAAVQIAAAMGCHVTAVTSQDSKVQYLKHLGAKDVIVAQGSRFSARDMDMSFEAVGEPTFSSSLRCLRAGGRMVLVGNVSNAAATLPLGLAIIKGLSVIGSDSVSARELTDTFAFMTSHGIRTHVHSVRTLEQVQEAHDELECKHSVCGRIVLQLRPDW